MARTARTQGEELQPQLRQPIEVAQARLSDRIQLGEELLAESSGIGSEQGLQSLRQKRYTWSEYNEDLLRSLFSNPDRILRQYRGGPFIGMLGGAPDPLHVQLAEFRDDMQRDVRRLSSIVERLALFEGPSGSPTAPTAAKPATLSVFVVHGHNEGARLGVVRFLETTGTNFDVKVLSEAVNKGRTIIEKFEDEAGAATFAVVLLTADDEGGPKDKQVRRPRGRQNVVLEMGYFFGKLGRSKVAILFEEGVELPSDAHGIAYIPLDGAGGWRLELAKELRAAGHHLDLTKAP